MSGKHRRPDPEQLETPAPAESGSPASQAPPVAPVAPPPAVHPPVPAPESVREAPVVEVAAPARPADPWQAVEVRRDRAAERARRKTAIRRRNMVALAAGAVLVIVASVAAYLLTTTTEDPPADDKVTTGPAAQETLLVQVTGEDGVSAANALVGVTPTKGSAAVVLVPSRLLVDVAGTGNLPFGETATLPEPSAPAQALTDLLGVRVDDTWVLTAGGLADLVDAVGGVQAAVDVDVVETDADGKETIVVPAGTAELDGKAAAAYATYLAEGEPEQARLARFDDVLNATMAKLPEDPEKVTALLEALGEESESTLNAPGLATRLSEIRTAAAGDEITSDVLPVTEIDTGDEVTSYGIDSGEVAALMRSMLPGALQKDSGGEVLRVLVENGVGTPGLVELARAKLVADGFRFVNGGNAADFGFDESAVIIPDGTEKNVQRGQRVAESLGLPESAVSTSDRGQTVADVIVILGKDFVP